MTETWAGMQRGRTRGQRIGRAVVHACVALMLVAFGGLVVRANTGCDPAEAVCGD